MNVLCGYRFRNVWSRIPSGILLSDIAAMTSAGLNIGGLREWEWHAKTKMKGTLGGPSMK